MGSSWRGMWRMVWMRVRPPSCDGLSLFLSPLTWYLVSYELIHRVKHHSSVPKAHTRAVELANTHNAPRYSVDVRRRSFDSQDSHDKFSRVSRRQEGEKEVRGEMKLQGCYLTVQKGTSSEGWGSNSANRTYMSCRIAPTADTAASVR